MKSRQRKSKAEHPDIRKIDTALAAYAELVGRPITGYSPTVAAADVDKPQPEGRKDDGGKLRFDLMPPDAFREVVRVLTMGALKYDDRNWELGMDYGRCEAALQRHFNQYAMGVDIDAESNMPHMAHVAVNALFILAMWLRGIGNDNRPEITSARCFPFIHTSA